MSLNTYLSGYTHLSLDEMISNAEIINVFILFIVAFGLLYLGFDFISRHLFKKDLFTDRKTLFGMYFIFTITLIAYSVYILIPSNIPSAWYHAMMILFPLGLFASGREKIENFGFKKGYFKNGLLSIGLTVASISIIVFLNINIYNKSTTLNLDIFSILFLDAVILAPLIEEILLRYFQYKIKYINDFLAIFFVAALGTLYHIPRLLVLPNEYAQYVIPLSSNNLLIPIIQIFLLQVSLALIYDYTESIYYPIIIHSIINIASWIIRF